MVNWVRPPSPNRDGIELSQEEQEGIEDQMLQRRSMFHQSHWVHQEFLRDGKFDPKSVSERYVAPFQDGEGLPAPMITTRHWKGASYNATYRTLNTKTMFALCKCFEGIPEGNTSMLSELNLTSCAITNTSVRALAELFRKPNT